MLETFTNTVLCLVIPAYNPHDNWSERLVNFVKKLEDSYPHLTIALVICTDGSKHGHDRESEAYISGAIPHTTYIHRDINKGKGYSVREGITVATNLYPTPLLLVTDWDLPFNYQTYIQTVNALLNGATIVVPQRDESYTHVLSVQRYFCSLASKFVNKTLLGLPLTDTQGGLKGISPNGVDAMLNTRINTFLYDTEFIINAVRLGIPLSSIPAHMRNGITVGTMKYRTLWNELKTLSHLLKRRWFSSASM